MNYKKYTLLLVSAIFLLGVGIVSVATAQSVLFDKDVDLQGTKKILNAANISIGTTNPVATLVTTKSGTTSYPIPGTSIANSALHIKPSTAVAGDSSAITFGAVDTGNGDNAQAGIYVQSSGGYGTKMYFATTNSYATGAQSRMMIDHAGNVGIGTTSPVQKLDTWGNVYLDAGLHDTELVLGFATNGYAYHRISSNRQTGEFSIKAGVGGSGHYLTFGTGDGTERMRISQPGDVGIGTTAPGYKLDVAGTGRFTQPVIVGTPTAASHAATKSYVDSSVATSPTWTVSGTNIYNSNSGNVGIGTTNPAHKLDIVGSYYSQMVVKGTCSGTVAIDWNAGNTQHCVLGSTPVTFTFSGGRSGGNYKLILKQDGVGSRTVSWPATIRWGSGGEPYLTPVPGKTDYVGFIYNGIDGTYDGVAFNSNY